MFARTTKGAIKRYLGLIDDYYSIYTLVRQAIIVAVIFASFDILNIPSMFIANYGKWIVRIVLFGGLCSGLLLLMELGLADVFKLPAPNFLDSAIFIILFSAGLYILFVYLAAELYLYKLILIGVLMLGCIAVIVWRIRPTNSRVYQYNTVDFRDILENNFSLEGNERIFVEERAVDYDILNRTKIIDLLTTTIWQVNPEESFVISLEGKWGSGKTTIIKNTTKRLQESEDLIIVDDFDPWTYQDQESLFKALLSTIIKKSGLKYSYFSTRRLADEVFDTVFGGSRLSWVGRVQREHSSVDILRKRINIYLKSSGKKLVFFIDNIDRSKSKNVTFLFKLVGHIFNLEHVVYVLSFDREEVKKAFKAENISFDYVKKVIQMQLHVPKIMASNLQSVIRQGVHNLLLALGEKSHNLDRYDVVVDTLCSHGNDLRDFKRYINSVINAASSAAQYLDKRDFLIIEYVRLHNPKLYLAVRENRQYFISYHKRDDLEVYLKSLNSEKFNEDAKEFFKDLFSDKVNKEYEDVLVHIFPNVEQFKSNTDIQPSYSSSELQAEVARYRGICSGKYFELYFSYALNTHIAVTELAEETLHLVKQVSNPARIRDHFIKLLKTVPHSNHKALFEHIQLTMGHLSSEAAYLLLQTLFVNVYLVANQSGFFDLSARQRVTIIMSELLLLIDDAHFADFVYTIKEQYNKFNIIRDIAYWLDNAEPSQIGSLKESRQADMETLCQQIADEILFNQINLYEEPNYYPHNIWALAKVLKSKPEQLRNYVSKVLDERSVFRLIWDITNESISSRHVRYFIREENLRILATEQDIASCLQEANPVTTDEKFVVEIWHKYANKENDVHGDPAITTKKIQELKL